MGQVKIKESTINLTHGRTGKVAVFIYVGDDDPIEKLDLAVSEYVGNEGKHEFIDINNDNPWVRVVLSDINEIDEVNFDPTVHKLKP